MSSGAGPSDHETSSGLITVLCVDDSVELLTLLCARIDKEHDMTALQGINDAATFARLAQQIKPRVAIVDLTMPGHLAPLKAIQSVSESSDVRIVAYSAHDDRNTINEVIEAGAWGFVSKHAELSAVIQAIRRVAAGEVVF